MAKDATQETGQVEPKSNRPENTKFTQQKLDAWQPILTPAWVIGTFIVVGLIFVPVGVYLWKLSSDLFESVKYYDSYDQSLVGDNALFESCTILDMNVGYAQLKNGSRTFEQCTVSFTFDQDIEPSDEVYMYYQIDNFYQNHRRYVKSLSESQLKGDTTLNPVSNLKDTTLETACDPAQSFANADFGDRVYYPCGLIALSVFNDGISLQSFTRGSTTQEYSAGVPIDATPAFPEVELNTEEIAWPSDLQNKYRNPTATDCSASTITTGGGNLCPSRYYQYQFLWQTYDQFVCYANRTTGNTNAPDTSTMLPCTGWTDYVNTLGTETYGSQVWNDFVAGQSIQNVYGNGCASCPSGILTKAGGIREPEDTSSATSKYGVRDEGFVVWMRTAGLPTFRKLYGSLKPPAGGFKKGDVVRFSVIPNFLVRKIEGSKALVLGTTSPLGGKNDILGIAYMTVGSICLFLALVFAIKMKLHPRKLGDPQYLHWKKN